MKGTELERTTGSVVPFDILAWLEEAGAATPTGLVLPSDLTYEEYEAVGFALSLLKRKVTWAIADWIIYGERRFGERYAQACEVTGLAKGTLMNYVSTGLRVPPERRRAGLGMGHHTEVAKLEPQEQIEWLDKAATNGWSREELRSRLRPRPENLTPALGEGLEEAARDLVACASSYGDGFVVCRSSFIDLCAALGEEVPE